MIICHTFCRTSRNFAFSKFAIQGEFLSELKLLVIKWLWIRDWEYRNIKNIPAISIYELKTLHLKSYSALCRFLILNNTSCVWFLIKFQVQVHLDMFYKNLIISNKYYLNPANLLSIQDFFKHFLITSTFETLV